MLVYPGAEGLKYCLSLDLQPYFVNTSSQCPDQTAHKACLGMAAPQCDKYKILMGRLKYFHAKQKLVSRPEVIKLFRAQLN